VFLPTRRHRIFRGVWWSVNSPLVVVLLALVYSGGWEFSVRRRAKHVAAKVPIATFFRAPEIK
jgi:hypothetical protein